jgi:hypothetical protein
VRTLWWFLDGGNPVFPTVETVTGLVAGARVGSETGWAEHLGAHDHDVELVLAFLNTVDVERDTDVLDDPGLWRGWAIDQNLAPPDGESTEHVRAVRDALRAAVLGNLDPSGNEPAGSTPSAGDPSGSDPARTDRSGGDRSGGDLSAGAPWAAAGGQVRVELLGGMPTLVSGDPVGAVLAASARLAVLGEWNRVKICPADDCRWAFFDHSRNRSRTWCSMRVCGNRTKARNWRARRGDRRGATESITDSLET